MFTLQAVGPEPLDDPVTIRTPLCQILHSCVLGCAHRACCQDTVQGLGGRYLGQGQEDPGWLVVGWHSLLHSMPERVPTCSCPRMSTPPGLMGCQGARFSPVPSFSPSWNASHMPSRVVQVMQMWCHLPSLTNKGSCATCGCQQAGEDLPGLNPTDGSREWTATWSPRATLLLTTQDSCWVPLPCLVRDTPNTICLVCDNQGTGHSWFWAWPQTYPPMLA